MKASLIGALLLIAATNTTQAQRPSLTILATVNHSLSGPNNTKYSDDVPNEYVAKQRSNGKVGYSFGALVNFPLSNHFRLSTGAEAKWKGIENTFYTNSNADFYYESVFPEEFIQLGIPIGISYYLSSHRQGLFFNIQPSIDILLSSDLQSHKYDTFEFTGEAGIGYTIPDGHRSFDLILSYAAPLVNPYADPFTPIRIIRLKLGFTRPL